MKNETKQDLNTLNRLVSPPLGDGGGSFFITGIGTGIGKTLVSAIITEALQADYWKPIQAGTDGTDNERMKGLISNTRTQFYDEVYTLKLPASPHIAAREEGITISLDAIVERYNSIQSKTLVIEGAGGLMVPLNDNEFVIDLIERLQAKVILVSRNYLGSINHSLLTAALCKQRKLDVAGWIFNDQYLQYEDEIAAWSGYPRIASIPRTSEVNRGFVQQQAQRIKPLLMQVAGL
jgi:dethiobiotin synthetase